MYLPGVRGAGGASAVWGLCGSSESSVRLMSKVKSVEYGEVDLRVRLHMLYTRKGGEV